MNTVKFPIDLRRNLGREQLERWQRYYACASDRQRTREDGIWRRTQKAINAAESRWQGDGDNRRRIVHYSHQYGLTQTDTDAKLVLKNVYVYYSLSLPSDELAAIELRIEDALSNGPWLLSSRTDQASEWACGDLTCRLTKLLVHPEDVKAGRSLPAGYRTLDVSIRSAAVLDVPEQLPWEVLAKGMRIKDQPGRPQIIPDLSLLADFLPFHVELGCGASIEAGVPALHHLHGYYKVANLDTGHFIFGGPQDDFVERLVSHPGKELVQLTGLFQAAFFAEPTRAHSALLALRNAGYVVGPIMTNNFDGLAHRVGLEELFLRRYDETIPAIALDPSARSLLVIGSHADRRRVQARARERGLRVFYLDPEGYSVDGKFINYPLESARDDDFLCRKGASEGLMELCSILGLEPVRS